MSRKAIKKRKHRLKTCAFSKAVLSLECYRERRVSIAAEGLFKALFVGYS